MPSESINDQLRNMKKNSDALDQSIGLNRILLTLIDNQKRTQRWMCILLVVSLLCNVAISAIFVAYESQFTSTTETTTVTQDSGDGDSNNVYQSGENAQYVQGDLEEVNTNGETDNNNYTNNPDKNLEECGQQE